MRSKSPTCRRELQFRDWSIDESCPLCLHPGSHTISCSRFLSGLPESLAYVASSSQQLYMSVIAATPSIALQLRIIYCIHVSQFTPCVSLVLVCVRFLKHLAVDRFASTCRTCIWRIQCNPTKKPFSHELHHKAR